jgi:hypothetical protein
MARANALAGNRGEELRYIQRADEAGQEIGNAEDRSIFIGDFHGGIWHGLR